MTKQPALATKPTITRKQGTAALAYILDLFGHDSQSPLAQSLSYDGITHITDLIAMDKTHIDDLTYMATVKDKQGSPTKQRTDVPRGHKAHIRIFQGYVAYRQDINQPLQHDYTSITEDDLNEYKVSQHFKCYVPGGTPPNLQHNYPPPVANPDIINFKKGIKRDPSQFHTLKRESDWDDWYAHITVTAMAQGVDEVLDPSFIPVGTDGKDLFKEKQKYLFQVLHSTVLTDKGKEIIKSYLPTLDAQKAFIDLIKYAEKSTAAQISSGTLLKYLTSAKIDDGQWKGTATGFIIHWKETVRKYHSKVKNNEKFSDSQQRVMLQNAVHNIPELRQVKITAELQTALHGSVLTFEQYNTLLQSAATQYDTSSRSIQQKRSVYQADVTTDYHPDFVSADTYNIDTAVDTIHANMSQSRSPNFTAPRLPHERWKLLSQDERAAWNSLSKETKSAILGISHPKPASNQRQSFLHDMNSNEPTSHPTNGDNHDPTEEFLINSTTTNSTISPADIRKVLSSVNNSKPADSIKPQDEISINGIKYRKANKHIIYTVSEHKQNSNASLVDRGANGGIAGNDVRLIPSLSTNPNKTVNVMGIDNHQITSIPLASVGGISTSQHGPVILIFHQYAHYGKGKSIHSPIQMESFSNHVNDKSIKTGGGQFIQTNDGYTLPLDIKDGLAYLPLRPFSDQEWEQLPHVVMTADDEWDPTILDNHISTSNTWIQDIESLTPGNNKVFNQFGDYTQRTVATHMLHNNPIFFDTNIFDNDDLHFFDADTFDNVDHDEVILQCMEHAVSSPKKPVTTKTQTPNYSSLRPYFAWLPTNVVQLTFNNTTQHARTTVSTILKKHYKSPYPALNVHRRDEPVATDTVYSDTPAIDDGSKIAQFFVGTSTMFNDVYGMKTDSQFVNTLEDHIRERGAMSKLISDCAQVELSKRVMDVLRALCISNWQSEPHQQHQNPAERRFQTVKRMTNTILDRSGSPASTWLLAMTYICFVLNYTYCSSINAIPIQKLTGSTPDISPLLRFYWWQPVYYKLDDSDFPSESTELRGRFVGIAEHVGHAMTYKILTDDTSKIIFRSNVRAADVPMEHNLRLDPLCGEPTKVVKSKSDDNNQNQSENKPTNMPIVSPSDLVGRSFLMDKNDNGEKFRAKIVSAVKKHDDSLDNHPDHLKFVCSVNNEEYEEILSYNEILHHIEKEENTDIIWKFKDITAHQGPLSRTHPDYKGSSYNVKIEWENGEITYEPLDIIAKDDPVTCAIYAKKNGLLEEPGWKRFKSIAKREKKMLRMANQAKLRSYRLTPKYKFGYIVPRDYNHARKLDSSNDNEEWGKATQLELTQIDEYETFIDLGKGTAPPEGYKKIGVHLVYDVKHDGRHKARLVADGHKTDIPLTSVYSGVVSLRGLRMVVFLAELNNLELWGTDIGNAYLEAKTQEKVYIIAGPEFGNREGHTLIINKALYGLRSSGLRWHEKLANILSKMGFFPCKAEPDIWMRKVGNIYEYIAVYVDDLAIAAKDPKQITDVLTKEYKFKLKGTGPISYHLGCDFFRDGSGTLCFSPKKFIDKMIDGYMTLFKSKPKTNVSSPLEKGDHPELDYSELLDEEGISIYQSLIGSLQWAVSLGRLDIMTAVMTMSSFRAIPRKGHLERVKRIYSYITKMKHATIRVRTEEPDFSALPSEPYKWDYSVYGDVKEELPKDAPEPLGKYVTTTHYVDANLFHDILTGRSVTGILHLLNKTPIDYYSKKQATVETATYGSEFVAARTCTEQIIDLRTTLRYLGVPIREKCYMFGDNESVVNSASVPHAKLHKRHVYLSFHRVREAIAAGIMTYRYLKGEDNPADILSKHWGYQQVWKLLQPILFWEGDTMDLIEQGKVKDRAKEHKEDTEETTIVGD